MDLDAHLPAIAAGDASAFAAWLSGAEGEVRRSLRSFASSVDTEAVLQESLLRTWQVAPRLASDGRPNTLLRVALRIARNAAIDEIRRARLDPTGAEDLERALHDDAGAVHPAPPDPLLRDRIEACRAALPRQPGRALAARLSARGGVDDRALAEALQMQLNTFLESVGRARRLLAECLSSAGVAWGGS